MKIICTKAEKENLLDCVASSPFCPLGNWNCSGGLSAERCAMCFEDFEEWEVVDEDDEDKTYPEAQCKNEDSDQTNGALS